MAKSRKRSARDKEIAAFKASLAEGSGLDSLFAREDARLERDAEEHEAALRKKACERKQRYASLEDAQEALAACEAHGTRGLHIYRCPYCRGWHLTHKEPKQ